MNATYQHKGRESVTHDLVSRSLHFLRKQLCEEILTPEEMAEWSEIDKTIEASRIEPSTKIQDAIARIRQAYPAVSTQHDEEQREVLDLLFEQKISEARAWHLMLRQEQARCIRQAFNDESCHLAWESYLHNARLHFPPRPVQTRLAVHAARSANILTLYGGSGLGKTTAAIRGIVLRAVDGITRRRAVAVSGSMLSRMSAGERGNFIERVTRTEASLLLDDIDKGGKAEGVSSAIFEIIEAREHMDALTIITTNCNGAKLSAKLCTGYGAPIVTRIKRGIIIDFDPEDIDEAECREDLGGKLKTISRQPQSTPKPPKIEFCL